MFTILQIKVFCVFCVIFSLGYICEAGISEFSFGFLYQFARLNFENGCFSFTARTEGPLKCHICDPDTCATFDRKAKPQVWLFLIHTASNVRDINYINVSYVIIGV